MLGLKLIHVCKRGHRDVSHIWVLYKIRSPGNCGCLLIYTLWVCDKYRKIYTYLICSSSHVERLQIKLKWCRDGFNAEWHPNKFYCVYIVICTAHAKKWGMLCQKYLSRAWTSNYIPYIYIFIYDYIPGTVGCNYLLLPLITAIGITLLKYEHSLLECQNHSYLVQRPEAEVYCPLISCWLKEANPDSPS